MKYSLMKALILVSASVSAQATEIDNLINASGSLKQTFALGIQTVGGQSVYASQGLISPQIASNAHVSYDQAQAYNNALTAVTNTNYNITAQEYLNDKASDSMQVLDSAVDAYVTASVDLIGAVQVNQMAVEAVDQQTTNELQTYITNNDMTITNDSVDTYNGALDTVQNAAQTAATFKAASSDQSLVDSAQAQADALGESFSFAQNTFYAQNTLSISLVSGSVALDMSEYVASAQDVLTAGQQSTFYTSSPVCFYGQGCE